MNRRTNNAISLVNLCFRGFTFGPGTGIATGTQLSNNSFTDFTQLSWGGISPLAATCNWWGTTVPATIAASISGSVNYITWLSSGVDVAPGTPGFQPAANTCSGCPSGNVIQNTNTGLYYCSIQAAIDDPLTVNTNTISVGPGMYAENIIVSKSLTILGPNTAIDPCSGTRVPEAVVMSAVSDIKGLGAYSIFDVQASNVIIKGLTNH